MQQGEHATSLTNLTVYVGWDPREVDAWRVCDYSIRKRATCNVEVRTLYLDELRKAGLYRRPTEIRDGRLWDCLSEAPMSTEFALSRFFVPHLAKTGGHGTSPWVLFCDCDFLWLGDVRKLVEQADTSKALVCVQHRHEPTESLKMDDQLQLLYARKNWSSMMLFNVDHPAHERLTLEVLNTVPGRDLHRFCWLDDDEIGAVPDSWNWLEGWSPRREVPPDVVHFTRGGPWMSGWTNVGYASLWLQEFDDMRSQEPDAGQPEPQAHGTA